MRRDVPRRVFRGPDLGAVSARARAELGDDALVLSTRTVRPGLIEIVAADAHDVARFERRLTSAPLGAERSSSCRRRWGRRARPRAGASRPRAGGRSS